MNYERLYNLFIEKFKTQKIEKGVYTEKHHIVPTHAGGGNEENNFVTLTFKQHVFIHKLRWYAFREKGDYVAYKMMSGVGDGEKRRNHFYYYGKLRAAEGWMDKIRPLANNDIQRAKARANGLRNVESGHLERIRKLAYKVRAENKIKRIKKKRAKTDEKYKNEPEKLRKYKDRRDRTMEEYKTSCEKFAASVIENAFRVEEFLHKTSPTSKYNYISPEGLSFETTKFAAAYYGNVSYQQIENWAKRNQYGWKRFLKTDSD